MARAFYDSCQSNELDVKLRIPNLGHQLLPKLQAGDPDATGLCSKQHLLKVLLLHFNVLLTPGEQDCLIAEWQVMDHVTGEVSALCLHRDGHCRTAVLELFSSQANELTPIGDACEVATPQ